MKMERGLSAPDSAFLLLSVGLLSPGLYLILLLLALELVSVHAVLGKSAPERQQYLR